MMAVTVPEVGKITYDGSGDPKRHEVAQNGRKGKKQPGQSYFLLAEETGLNDDQAHRSYRNTHIGDDAISDSLSLNYAQNEILIDCKYRGFAGMDEIGGYYTQRRLTNSGRCFMSSASSLPLLPTT